MNLLTNAVESIQVGVEDYAIATRPRLLSAVRNIHAGLLLLFKEALLRRCPPHSNEVLVKAKTKPVAGPGGALTFVGSGRVTVNAQQIRERFTDLGISVEWGSFQAIAEARNEVEHYFTSVSAESLRGVVARAFVIARDFMIGELGESPLELLGQATWSQMLQASELYEAEKRACDEIWQKVDWPSAVLLDGVRQLRCEECSSDLLVPIDAIDDVASAVLVCRTCGATVDSDQFVPQAVAEALDYEAYLAAKDGGDDPYATCPECGLEAYVMSEGACASCGESFDEDCARCGNSIPISEFESAPLCSYCAYVMSKDD